MLKFKILLVSFLLSGCANYIKKMHNEFDSYEKSGRNPQSKSGIEVLGEEGDKRYVADDFSDGSKNQSLWVGDGNENFFATGGLKKEKGDLVTILVNKKLKDQISSEVERFYPSSTTGVKTDGKNSPQKAKEKSTEKLSTSNEIYDKISSVVSKEIKENHIILTGRKQIIYNESRHLVEVQALIHRKDITSDDSIESSKIIQSSIKVLR